MGILVRVYMVPLVRMQDMSEMWYDQSDALIKQIDELESPAHALDMRFQGNAPQGVRDPMPVSGGIPLTGAGAAHRLWRPDML